MIVIVGAGISGLALAHELAARGRDFMVLEAAARVGGAIRSGTVADHLLEWGPQRARLTPAFHSLVTRIGLGDELITAPSDLPLFVFRDGRLRRVPFSAREFIRTDLLSWRGKLRMLAEPFSAGARQEESVAGFLVRKLGREAYENIAGPLYGGLYASDPRDMVLELSLGSLLRELNVRRSLLRPLLRRGRGAPPPACSFRTGMEALPRALHERYRDRVRLASPVHSLSRSGSGYAVQVGTERIRAEHIVLTPPAAATAALLGGVAPSAAARVASLAYNPLAIVHLRASTGRRGLGYQVSLAESLITRGVTWNDSLFGRTGVHTAFLGGATNRWVADAPGDELGALAVAEFRTVTGEDAEVLSVARAAMPAWDRSWSALRTPLDLPPGLHIHANWHARPGLPGRLAASRRLADELTRT